MGVSLNIQVMKHVFIFKSFFVGIKLHHGAHRCVQAKETLPKTAPP